MKLRELRVEDAPKMFEWMHDDNVTKYMDTSFLYWTAEIKRRTIILLFVKMIITMLALLV